MCFIRERFGFGMIETMVMCNKKPDWICQAFVDQCIFVELSIVRIAQAGTGGNLLFFSGTTTFSLF